MNKIILDDVKVVDSVVDDCISYNLIDNEDVKVLNIDVLESCDLDLDYRFSSAKVEVCINVCSNIILNVNEIISGESAKVRTKYVIDEFSFVNICTNGVSIKDGSILFNVSSFIGKNITGCVATQDNKIINLNDNECIIKPNLYIDCDDVSATHSAWVGSFREDELFYLQSRGISMDDAIRLLISGFLTSNISDSLCDYIKNILDMYWR